MKINNLLVMLLFSSMANANYVSFVGDLVARDLIGAGPIGHVGIASAPYYKMRPTMILEAMGDPPHIQQNSIDDFKSRSKYWGSKGGLISPQSLESYQVANRIVRQYYACPAYSYTWQWVEGKILPNTRPISCGLFRCDTLVNYAYAFNERYSLPTYDTKWTNPLAIYNYFPLETDLLIPERYKDRNLEQKITNESIDSINENNIKTLDSKTFYQNLQNTEHVSEQQINYLWKLINNNPVNNDVKILFYNFILFENPKYLLNEIILQAKKEKDETRNRLLLIIQRIYQEQLRKNDSTNFNSIINYFKELQKEQLTKDDAGIVYRALATLAPKDIQMKNQKLITMDKIHIDLLLIKSNPENQNKYVQDIINNLEHPDDSLVVTATYQYLTLLLIDSDLKFFSQTSKRLFKKYLNKKKIIDNTQCIMYPSAYIEFKALLNANSTIEISQLTNEYMNSLNPEMKQIIPYGFSDFTQKQLNIR